MAQRDVRAAGGDLVTRVKGRGSQVRGWTQLDNLSPAVCGLQESREILIRGIADLDLFRASYATGDYRFSRRWRSGR